MKKTAISSVIVIFTSCWVLLFSATADDYEVFRTSSDQYYTGNLGGVSSAHAICGTLASNAGLPGSWKAWICDDSNYPDADFVKAGVGDRYVLVDGTPVAGNGTDQNAWTQLTTQNLLHAINMDQNGTSSGMAATWTNCHQAGTTDTTDKDCGNWQSTSGQGRIGISTTTFDDWTDWGTSALDCTTAVRLYCFSQTGQPTLVELLTFVTERISHTTILVVWETASEIDTVGYNILRSDTEEGPYEQINETIIPSEGGLAVGASYEYIDEDCVGTCFYKLEDIDSSGVSTFHGPVQVEPALPHCGKMSEAKGMSLMWLFALPALGTLWLIRGHRKGRSVVSA